MTSLVTVLVGPPCVGKSTYLKKLDYDFVISSDDVVEILCERAGIQYHNFFKYSSNSDLKKQHQTIFKQLIKESKNFEHVVWDLTNLTKKARNRIFNHYPKAIFKAVVFDYQGSESLILKRNQLRFKQHGKYVDEMVIKDMFLSYEPISYDESFNDVTVVKLCENGILKP
jgi:predicted kinase